MSNAQGHAWKSAVDLFKARKPIKIRFPTWFPTWFPMVSNLVSLLLEPTDIIHPYHQSVREAMDAAAARPDLVTYSTVMSACDTVRVPMSCHVRQLVDIHKIFFFFFLFMGNSCTYTLWRIRILCGCWWLETC